MQFTRRTILLIAGCGCLLLMAFCVALLALLFLFTSQRNNVATAPRPSFLVATAVPAGPAAAFSRPASTSPRTIVAIEQYVAAQATANARACPGTGCAIVRVFNRGDAITTAGQVAGDAIQGSSNWTRVILNGREAFVHSGSVSPTRPQPLPVQQARPARQQPGQGLQAQPTSDTRNAYPGLSCKAIREQYGDGNFTPDHPAYSRNRDRDGDGIACEPG